MKVSMSIGRGFMKYPMSGRNLTGSFLPLQCKASFRGSRWWWKRTSSILFIVCPGSRDVISSMGTNVGKSLWDVKELQYPEESRKLVFKEVRSKILVKVTKTKETQHPKGNANVKIYLCWTENQAGLQTILAKHGPWPVKCTKYNIKYSSKGWHNNYHCHAAS